MLMDKLKQRRRMSKKEAFDLKLLESYLPMQELKKVRKLVRRGRCSINLERNPVSFLITGKNLIPILTSSSFDFSKYNRFIVASYKSKVQEEFSPRVFDVLPNFIAPDIIGQSIEKRAAATILFSSNLNVLFVKHGEEILEFLSQFKGVKVYSRASKSMQASLDEKGVVAKVGSERTLSDLELKKFDFIFRLKKPQQSSISINIPSETKKANLDFIKEYVELARELSVNVPKELDSIIKDFVMMRGLPEEFVASVRELAKSLARMELRSKLMNKDIARAFEIASASVKK